MAWKAELMTVAKNEGNVVATVKFTDDTTGETFNFDVRGNDLTPDSLALFCENTIKVREARDTAYVQLEAMQKGLITLPREKV
tara:strand:+ start:277 stop:525 length:249 start_codon:yes stop_codon:yes gene_type:complete